MDTLNYAKHVLIKNNYKMVVVKDGDIVVTSNDRGIKPIYDVYTKSNGHLKGSFVADRIIGKAAALFLINGKIDGLYTDIISEGALDLLKDYPIQVQYEKKVPYILNREGNDLCPIESIAKKSKGIDEMIKGIEDFFIKVGMVKDEK